MEIWSLVSIFWAVDTLWKRWEHVWEGTHGHDDAAYTYIWTQSLSYPCALPEDAHDSVGQLLAFWQSIARVECGGFSHTRSCFGPWYPEWNGGHRRLCKSAARGRAGGTWSWKAQTKSMPCQQLKLTVWDYLYLRSNLPSWRLGIKAIQLIGKHSSNCLPAKLFAIPMARHS